jgi:hypothetical protein
MSWEEIYTIMKDVDGETYLVIRETPTTDHTVMFGLTGDKADFAANTMNEVYNQVKKDIESGRLKEKK